MDAPAELGFVIDFVNSNDREGGNDEWADAPGLRRWLTARGVTGRVVPEDVQRARSVRESLRACLLAHHDGEIDERAVRRLDRLSAAVPLRVRFDERGPRVEPAAASGLDAAIGRVLADVAAARVAGMWERLKACRSETCQWAFYDASKNQSKRWCSMGVCGNRAKTRSYRERRRTPEG